MKLHFEKLVLLPLNCCPYTMQIKPFRALFAQASQIDSPSEFCDDAKNSFKKYLENGLYDRFPKDAFYVYQIEHGRRLHIGLVGLNHVNDFLQGHVKKHENTLSEKEQQQKELFLRWKAILKPVLVTHEPVAEIQIWLNSFTHSFKPMNIVRFKKDNAVHRYWAITNPEDIAHLRNLYATKVKDTYIADGHHRSSTTALLYENPDPRAQGLDFSHLFCAWFASDQLDILDYNRVVEGVKKIGAARFMALLSQIFDITVLDQVRPPAQKHEIVMCLGKDWYALNWKPAVIKDAPKGYDTLDADLLNDLVINKIFDIKDVRTDTRLSYVEGSKGLAGLEKSTHQKPNDRVGFALFPVIFEDMAKIADAGDVLPPKSTYFEPRLKSGLLVRLLEPMTAQ